MVSQRAVLDGHIDVVDLSTAENKLLGSELLERLGAVTDCLAWSQTHLAYSEGVGGSPPVRRLMAGLFNAHFDPKTKVEPSHIVLGAGGSFALEALVEDLCDYGDGIMIATPYWPGLDLLISIYNSFTIVKVNVPLDIFFNVQSIQWYEDALKAAPVPVKAVLICNPHNPLGRNYPKETLQVMFDFCSRHGLHYISDEVYALSQHRKRSESGEAGEFVSALSLDTIIAPDHMHVLYSLSKDFGCNGVRMGCFVSQHNKEVVLSGSLSTFGQTSTVACIYAQNAILATGFIDFINCEGRSMLKAAYETVETFMQMRHIEYVPANAGMFVFAKLCPELTPTMQADARFKSILKEGAVAVSAGTDYHFTAPGWYRLCYACSPEMLELGLQRISECIGLYNNSL